MVELIEPVAAVAVFLRFAEAEARPTARIIRPPQFHPEIARAKREQEAMREWRRLHPDRDPIEYPLYQERIARLRERIARPSPGETSE